MVSANVAAVATPAVLAAMLYVPDSELAVAFTDTMPDALVVADSAESTALAPVDGAANVTTASATGLLPASLTCTESGIEKAAPAKEDWLVPPRMPIDAAAPVTVDSAKFAGVASPAAFAVAVKLPNVTLAVAVVVATPAAFVTAVGGRKIAPAPEGGPANATRIPGTGLPDASRTVAWSPLGNAVPGVVVCGVPAVATIDAATPGELVSANDTGVPAPAALAAIV